MKKKKFLSLLLVLAMCLTLIPAAAVPVAAAEETGNYNGATVDTASKTVTFTTPANLVKFAKDINDGWKFKIDDTNEIPAGGAGWTFKLGNDIDLGSINWTPIGKIWYDHYFKGTFDGNNCIISNLAISNLDDKHQGLFGYVKGTIKNVNVTAVSINGNNECWVGGVVGYIEGDVINCSASGTITGGVYVGGVVGYVYNGNVTGCYADGNVTATGSDYGDSDVGGVVGNITDGNVTNCYAAGNVNGLENNVGGVVGYCRNSVVYGCHASGSVNGHSQIGGVVGYAHWGGSVTDCYAAGNVIGTGNCVGGVVGLLGVGGQNVTNCHYTTGEVKGSYQVGGVLGSGTGGGTSISECYSTGAVTGTGKDGEGNSCVGGVVGKMDGSVTNCYATGNVSGSANCVGGAVGRSSGIIENCYTTGDVKSTGGHVGGVVGYDYYNCIKNCYATGDVEGTTMVGGVAGYGRLSLENCYATGAVTGTSKDDKGNSYVGGVVGYTDKAAVNCVALNTEINAPTDSKSYGRVVGSDSIYHNSVYAWNGMKVNGNIVTGGTSHNNNGADLTADLEEGLVSGDYGLKTAFTSEIWTAPTTVINSEYHCMLPYLTELEPSVKPQTPYAVTGPEVKPEIQIDYYYEELTGFANKGSYTINGEAVTPVDGKLAVEDYIGKTISIVKKGNYVTTDSTAQELTVPARPAAPTGLAGVNETYAGENDGKITGLTGLEEYKSYQYKKTDETGWHNWYGYYWYPMPEESAEITNLEPAVYQVRIGADYYNGVFASESTTVTIASGEERTYTLNVADVSFDDVTYGYIQQPDAKSISISNTGNSDARIVSVEVSGEDFTVGGSGDTVPAGGSIDTWTIIPKAGLGKGSHTATITVTYYDGDEEATATGKVSFTVNGLAQDAPAAPEMESKTYNSVTLKAIEDNANGAKAQYSKDGISWQDSPSFTDLTGSTDYSFYARYAEVGEFAASPASEALTVKTDAAPSHRRGKSSSNDSIIKTETTTNSDGSTTTTETRADGTKVETTAAKDGTQTVVVSQSTTDSDGAKTETRTETVTGKDGTKTEIKSEVKTAKDGTTTSSKVAKTTDAAGSSATTTTVTDAQGKASVKAEAEISEKAVEAAQKNNTAITIPVDVKATSDSKSAPTVSIKIDVKSDSSSGKSSVKVEIPVTNVNSGTVAVLVKADGSEEVVRTCVNGENGVILNVSGDVTVKIVDNSKLFTDTENHWSKDEVNFVASRGLFRGMGGSIFGVSEKMTRGMFNTVLARFAGVDTTPAAGQKWYEPGTEWAKRNGISDGTNVDGIVTREQMVTMFWRFAGCPEVSGVLSFDDADLVSDYARDAVIWATQNGLIKGIGENLVAPGVGSDRAQVAAVFARYVKLAYEIKMI